MVTNAVLHCVDRGWFGLTPLQKHVVICGFPRSGSTLLLVMAEHCVIGAKTFGREKKALSAARRELRNHPLMITKLPDDVFNIRSIRQYYATKQASARFVITLRDPRAVLTSSHIHDDSPYYCTLERWRAVYEHYHQAQCDSGRLADVLAIRYEDLVLRTEHVQQQLTEFVEWRLRVPFREYYDAASGASLHIQVVRNLSGLRPVDADSLDKWKAPEHRERIRHLLKEIPNLPDIVAEMGYETDDQWTREYR